MALADQNGLRWIRDVTLAEDLSQIRSEQAPSRGSLRNLAISLHRLAGATNIAKALRNYGRNAT